MVYPRGMTTTTDTRNLTELSSTERAMLAHDEQVIVDDSLTGLLEWANDHYCSVRDNGTNIVTILDIERVALYPW